MSQKSSNYCFPLCRPEELKAVIDANEAPLLIDVREPEEVEIGRIPGSVHIPMGEIPFRIQELEKHMDEEIIVYCHHGIRSGNIQQFLQSRGFERVRNLVGGIDAYSVRVDPAIPRY